MIVLGSFNPIHKEHIEYFNNAKALADELFVIVDIVHQFMNFTDFSIITNSKNYEVSRNKKRDRIFWIQSSFS